MQARSQPPVNVLRSNWLHSGAHWDSCYKERTVKACFPKGRAALLSWTLRLQGLWAAGTHAAENCTELPQRAPRQVRLTQAPQL